MNGQDGRNGRRGRAKAAGGGPRRDPLGRLSITRLLLTFGVLALTAVMTQRMLSPLVVGWRRAEALLAAEDQLLVLGKQARRLREEIAYKKTEGGRRLEAFEQKGVVRPGGRVVKTAPKRLAQPSAQPQTLGQQAQALREASRLHLYRKWRVLILCLFDKRLPPPTRT
jgi:hypothetical protein